MEELQTARGEVGEVGEVSEVGEVGCGIPLFCWSLNDSHVLENATKKRSQAPFLTAAGHWLDFNSLVSLVYISST